MGIGDHIEVLLSMRVIVFCKWRWWCDVINSVEYDGAVGGVCWLSWYIPSFESLSSMVFLRFYNRVAFALSARGRRLQWIATLSLYRNGAKCNGIKPDIKSAVYRIIQTGSRKPPKPTPMIP